MSTHVLRTREHVCKVMKNPRARKKSFKSGVIQDGWGVGEGYSFRYRCPGKEYVGGEAQEQ